MESVKAECQSCGGTGLYVGLAERSGAAVVCLTCGGTGCVTITYTPFERRRQKRGIKRVFRSGGRLVVTGVGPQGEGITYEEFQQGKMPT